VKIIALLSWYDELPEHLDECVRSLEGVADSLIAIDGAYELFPGGQTKSPFEQWQVLQKAAIEALGAEWQLRYPQKLWPRPGEVGKRKAMWAYGLELAEQNLLGSPDWLFWVDADEYVEWVVDGRGGLRERLETTERHVAEVAMVQREEKPGGVDMTYPIRRFFRALPELTCHDAHYHMTALAPGGERLTVLGNENYHGQLAPAEDLTQLLRLRHRKGERNFDRARARDGYYRVRQDSGDELLPRTP
jgi:hypothetical protein